MSDYTLKTMMNKPERLAPGPEGTADGGQLFQAFLQLVGKK